MDPREKKLPQWAQNSLFTLRSQIAELERILAIARRDAAIKSTGRVVADCLGGDGFPLDDRALVDFHLPGGKVSVMLRDNGSRLDLNAAIGTLCIHPQASNCAYVTITR